MSIPHPIPYLDPQKCSQVQMSSSSTSKFP
jgi:hypothetical protein